MKNIKRDQIVFGLFCLTYFVCSQFVPHYLNGQFVYPLFHWRLFNGAPIIREDYFIAVDAYNEKSLTESCLLQNCDFLPLIAKRNRIFRKVQQFGRAVEQSTDQAHMHRISLEEIVFSSEDSVSYRLVKLRYNPFDFVREQKVHSKKTLNFFTKSAAEK